MNLLMRVDQEVVNKLAQGGPMALSDSLVNDRLTIMGWMVVEMDNDADYLRLIESQEVASSLSSSSKDGGERHDEDIDVVGDEDVIREEEEEGREG